VSLRPAKAAGLPATRAPLAPRRRAALAPSAAAAGAVESAAFPVSAAYFAANAVGALVAPAQLLAIYGAAAGAATVGSAATVQANGALSLVLAVAAFRCFSASRRESLTSDTYQRLMLALALTHGALAAIGPAFPSAAGKAGLALNGALALALTATWAKASSRPAALLKDAFSGVGDILSIPSNWASWMYTAVALAAGYASFTALAAPAAPVLTKLLGAQAAAVGIVAYTLRNGADRGRLHRGTFKELNEGLAAGAAALAALLYRAAGAVTPAVGALAALAAVSAYLGLVAVQVRAGTNSTSQVDVATGSSYAYDTIADPLEKLCADDPDAEECKVFED
jgi:hypothetical protein